MLLQVDDCIPHILRIIIISCQNISSTWKCGILLFAFTCFDEFELNFAHGNDGFGYYIRNSCSYEMSIYNVE